MRFALFSFLQLIDFKMPNTENRDPGLERDQENIEEALIYHEKLLVIRGIIKRMDDMEIAHDYIVDSPVYVELRYKILALEDGNYDYPVLRDLYCSLVCFLRDLPSRQSSTPDVPSNGLRVVKPGEVRPPVDYFFPTFSAHLEDVKDSFMSNGPEHSIRRQVMSAALAILMGETNCGPDKVWPNSERKLGYEEMVREKIGDILAETKLSIHLEIFPYPEDKTNLICKSSKLDDARLQIVKTDKSSTDLESETARVLLEVRRLVRLEQDGKKFFPYHDEFLIQKLRNQDPGKLIFEEDWRAIAGDPDTRRTLAARVLPVPLPEISKS